MMQKRTLNSLLLISFLVAFAFSYSLANDVTFESKSASRCSDNVLNITVNNDNDVAAVEIVFEIGSTSGGAYFDAFSVNWDAGFTELGTRIVDLSQADGIAPDTVRLAALLIEATDVVLPAGSKVVATVSYTTNDVCAGEVTLDGAVFNYPIPATVETQFVNATTFAIEAVAVNAGVVTISNATPTLAAIPDATLSWATDVFNYTAVGDDGDLANGCEEITYSKVVGPAAMTVNATTGDIAWNPTGDDVCEHEIEIQVEDACGAVASRTFTICVTNEAPVVDSLTQDQPVWAYGDEVTGQIYATDPDGGPLALAYSFVSISPDPGVAVVVDPVTGAFSWQTEVAPEFTGSFVMTFEVTDGANVCDPCSPVNSATGTITVLVYGESIVIEKVHEQILGTYTTVDISMNPATIVNYPFAGYDFLIEYDNSALTFNGAEEGAVLTDCGWEYFTYRTGADGNCGSGCPTGLVRIVALAEYNDGPGHPDCFAGEGGSTETVLASLNFLITGDATFECQYVPINFRWYDCGDNTLSSVGGDTLLISRAVYNYIGDDGDDTYYLIPQTETEFPTISGALDECLELGGKNVPYRIIDFYNGGVDIFCNADIDARGDLNLDELGYTVADAVIFTNYFVYGLAAFANLPGENAIAAATAASDANWDGLTLTVADLVYLIRVIVGDETAYPDGPSTPKAAITDARLVTMNGNLKLDSELEISAAFVELAGNVTPYLLAPNMNMEFAFDGVNTRVIVVSPYEDLQAFTGEFLSIGNATVVNVEMATIDGTPVAAKVLPNNFALQQNYPNPFNPSTTIEFALPVTSDYSLSIYNVTGQMVAQFSGTKEAGVHQVVWEAGDNASGVYFYRLNTNQFSETHKMILLK